MNNSDLGVRMKTFYEGISKTKLMRRTPVAIRIDGKAFHTFTRGLKKPFDDILIDVMQETTKYLCENIQGCKFGYTQSDEITLILVDYEKLNSSAWFDYEIQKLCSISASMATMIFNRLFERAYLKNLGVTHNPEDVAYLDTLKKCVKKGAMFDARCFNIPKEEVTNLVYWRQLDAERNAVQMVGRAYYSQKELHGLSCKQIKDKLFDEKNIVWDTVQNHLRHGTAVVYRNGVWVIDKDMPMLKGENRAYLNERILYKED